MAVMFFESLPGSLEVTHNMGSFNIQYAAHVFGDLLTEYIRIIEKHVAPPRYARQALAQIELMR